MSNPTLPINIVMISWLVLPRIVSEIAFKRCPGWTYMIRPPYSPIRFGVSIVMLHPARTDLTDLNNENLSSGEMRIFHFKDSSPQFSNINNTTIQNVLVAQLSL